MSVIHSAGEPLPHIPDNMTLAHFMLNYRHPTRPAVPVERPLMIEDATGRLIYSEETRHETNALAAELISRFHIGEQHCACVLSVCIFSPNHVLWPVAVWALHKIGAVVTPANPAYTAEELVHQLKISRATLIIVHPMVYHVAVTAACESGIALQKIVLVEGASDAKTDFGSHSTISEMIQAGAGHAARFVERPLKPGEARKKLAFLCFSSGTTGLPKAVAISHYSLVANLVQIATYINSDLSPWEKKQCRSGDVALADIYGLLFVMHYMLYNGMPLVVMPKFEFASFLKSIERYRINYIPLVPPIMLLLCKHPDVKKHNMSSIRTIVSGAAPLSGELTQQLSEVLPNVSIAQGYGMTETAVAVSLPRLDRKIGAPGSAGVLIPGVSARIVRPDGSLAGRNEPGQLVVTGPAMAQGYLNDEKATGETFVDGWVYTGDEVMINDTGELFIVDRIKELLKVKGFQVAPAELEGFLLDHPDVSDVCIVGIQDDYNGDIPIAFVVPSANALLRIQADAVEADRIKHALVEYVAAGKAHYKQLTGGVAFIDTIPRNASGKLLRRLLRDTARSIWRSGKLSKEKTKL
ncbi:hypothetical protein POSPLADRAFT_1141924 [Postia placenta MAD-698-R-SB12]|uniref:AMP-dependent synthetase/ligase domain-containing protein n=1 Tax=Postia placenta MAD-698-R-SB12 TaxID=670580 RepID=A0A1X6N222_9APHY|nr:hypothetical protein POSPLADRAFT_1141924 [Postia placenta MAD-698-R-SB12]OSX62667.1 hypothetical protein POSPLADRAFT_1141924 [Postia placenta MAD-698-R-SB12]